MKVFVFRTRCGSREAKNLNNFLDFGTERRMESYYEAEGAYYWATFSLLLHSPGLWAENRLEHLKRLIILAHLRHLHPASPPHHLSDLKLRPYPVYKSTLIFFALIDAIYNNHFKVRCSFYLLSFSLIC
jgi:E3 ubiquitin-protein ligase UBR4